MAKKHKEAHESEVTEHEAAENTETKEGEAPAEEEVLYKGHGVVPVRQAQEGDPEFPAGADPSHLVLVRDFRGRHHSVNVSEVEPPLDPYPPPEPPPEEGASGASGPSGAEMAAA